MKKIFLVFFMFCSLGCIAQIPVLKVETFSAGSSLFKLADIDSLAFSPLADYLFVSYSGDKQKTFACTDVQQLTYSQVAPTEDISIIWNTDGSVSIGNPMQADGVSITASGADVVIRSIYPGEVNYCLSGTSADGSLRIYSDYKYQLTLLGLQLTNQRGAAICSQSKKKATLKLQKGYTSTLTDGLAYTGALPDEDEKGCLFSEGQLVFKGAGTLSVVARGKHGIVSDDYIEVENGNLNITATADASKAMKANEYIALLGGNVEITQSGSRMAEGSDYSYPAALKADETISISGGTLIVSSSAQGGRGLAAGTGISISGGNVSIRMTGNGAASSSSGGRPGGGGGPGGWGGGNTGSTSSSASFTAPCIKTDGYVNVSGGTLDLATTGIKGFGIKAQGLICFTGGTTSVHTSGTAAEGIESKTEVRLEGGRILSVAEQDDAINCAGKIICSGAWVYAVSNGNDAIDSNYGRSGAITVSDGVVVAISAAGSPEEGFDCDNNSYITIRGGYVFTGGGSQGGGGGWGGSSTSASVGSAAQAYCFTGSYALTKDSYYTVKNASDNVLFSIRALSSLTSSKNSLSLISAPDLSKNATNSILSGTAAPRDADAWDGYIYLGGSTSNTASAKTFTGK